MREARQPQALFSGGVVLARWAEEGPREGLLHPSAVEDARKDARKDALHALLTALPLIVEREADDRELPETELGLRSPSTSTRP